MIEKKLIIPRMLIEDWLPAEAIGVECMREEGSLSAKPPIKYFHVWWARRPLTVSRAAVLGSILPASFPHEVFERLIGFAKPGTELVAIRHLLDAKEPGIRIKSGFDCERAFRRIPVEHDLEIAHKAAEKIWGKDIFIMDPMAGGGSIPLESASFGFKTHANEYNPVACSILEATVDYPFRFGSMLADLAEDWAKSWEAAVSSRLKPYYYEPPFRGVKDYIFTRVVPCPNTGFDTPLVPDWHLFKPKNSVHSILAIPLIDNTSGTWKIRIVEQKHANKKITPPAPTYVDGKGISLFTGLQINEDWIKSKAQTGEMRSVLYAIAIKKNRIEFEAPEIADFQVLDAAATELQRLIPIWRASNIIPDEEFPIISTDIRPRLYGMRRWAEFFSPRQLLCAGILIEELRGLYPQIINKHGIEIGEAIFHLLAFGFDKFVNYNCLLTRWGAPTATIKGKMDRHDFSFKPAFAELSPCGDGGGINWSIKNVLKAYREICDLLSSSPKKPVILSMGSATSIPSVTDKSVNAIIVDPPYADNVQYSDLANFFYVWLKRTQGHRRPEWFSTYLCDHDKEAVVNVSRFKKVGEKTKDARKKAHEFYQKLMTESFGEMKRILRDDGVLTVMFTHKKQEAWEALFDSLIKAGFLITATWPVKTESEHSLHQARKNAAQSTVLLVARKRPRGAGIGYFDGNMKDEIRKSARTSAERLQKEGLNPVDQLVGSFGPAMEAFSRYDAVKTDTGKPVNVSLAIDEASDAVSAWRIEQLSKRGLEGVESEGKFYLLCWDVLGAAEFRFNEAKLLGHAVGMDVDQLQAAGLIEKKGDKIKILSATKRRRSKALEPDEIVPTLFGSITLEKKRRKKDFLMVHPNDPEFRTALDGCHALALRFVEAGSAGGGIGSAKALVRQQRWTRESSVAQLMEALVDAAPEALKFEAGKKSVAAEFPEFRAWHALLEPLFGITPPEWKKKMIPQAELPYEEEDEESEGENEEEGEDETEE